MYLDTNPPPAGTPITPARQASLRLVLDQQELTPIAEGSNLPRADWEPPIWTVGYDEVWAIAGIADWLTAIDQNHTLGVGAYARAREQYVMLPVTYKKQTVRMLGTWVQRRIQQLEAETADQRLLITAGWAAFELEQLARDERIRRLTKLCILPINPASLE